jgi:hypothetical protein
MKKLQRRYILKVMHIYTIKLLYIWFGFMVFNATFNNISVISWRSVFLVKETVTDKLYHVML